MGVEHTIFSADSLLLNSKFKQRKDVDDSHCISSSSPVEKLHDACQPCGGSLGAAVPTTFSALDNNSLPISTKDWGVMEEMAEHRKNWRTYQELFR